MVHYIHITDIDWDTDDKDNDEFIDPEALGLPREVLIEANDNLFDNLMEDPDDCIGNYLSDKFGWCHYGFNYDVHYDHDSKVREIIERLGEENILD